MQLDELRPWVAARGWRVVAELGEREQAVGLIVRRRADVLAVHRVAVLARSATELLQLATYLHTIGGFVASLRNADDVDTTAPSSELSAFLAGWRVRLDRAFLSDTTREGLDVALAGGGKRLGRPAATVTLDAVQALRARGITTRQICRDLEVGRSTLFRALKRART